LKGLTKKQLSALGYLVGRFCLGGFFPVETDCNVPLRTAQVLQRFGFCKIKVEQCSEYMGGGRGTKYWHVVTVRATEAGREYLEKFERS